MILFTVKDGVKMRLKSTAYDLLNSLLQRSKKVSERKKALRSRLFIFFAFSPVIEIHLAAGIVVEKKKIRLSFTNSTVDGVGCFRKFHAQNRPLLLIGLFG